MAINIHQSSVEIRPAGLLCSSLERIGPTRCVRTSFAPGDGRLLVGNLRSASRGAERAESGKPKAESGTLTICPVSLVPPFPFFLSYTGAGFCRRGNTFHTKDLRQENRVVHTPHLWVTRENKAQVPAGKLFDRARRMNKAQVPAGKLFDRARRMRGRPGGGRTIAKPPAQGKSLF